MHPNEGAAGGDTVLTYEFGPDESVTQAIATAVAEASGCTPVLQATDDDGSEVLDPLYSAIDPDSLETLVRPRFLERRDGGVTVSFTYQGYRVTVESNGLVRLVPLEPGGESKPC